MYLHYEGNVNKKLKNFKIDSNDRIKSIIFETQL